MDTGYHLCYTQNRVWYVPPIPTKIRVPPRIRTNNFTTKDRIKVRAAMEKSLQKTCLKIINIVNRDKDHIPPITGLDNPFPYQIVVNPRTENWGARMGIF